MKRRVEKLLKSDSKERGEKERRAREDGTTEWRRSGKGGGGGGDAIKRWLEEKEEEDDSLARWRLIAEICAETRKFH